MPSLHIKPCTRESRALGCLFGLVAGDSLGALIEFGPDRTPPTTLRDGGCWGLRAGQGTDDTEMALALARSLIAEGGFKADAVEAAYIAWLESEPFDVGQTIRASLLAARERRSAPVPPRSRFIGDEEEAAHIFGGGLGARSKANGALMRVAPIGIFAAGDPESAAALAGEDAGLTHPNPVCVAASAAYAAAIAVAVDGKGAGAIYESALEIARQAGDPEVLAAIEAAPERPPADYQTNAGLVTIALQNAFYRLLHEPSVEQAIIRTVAELGDTDTNGAIAGALAGSVHGYEAIPEDWRKAIQRCRLEAGKTRHPRPRAYWPVDLPDLAGKLVAAR